MRVRPAELRTPRPGPWALPARLPWCPWCPCCLPGLPGLPRRARVCRRPAGPQAPDGWPRAARRPGAALAELLAGNRRFVSGRHHGHEISAAAATASGGQQPYAVVIGCIDSRVPLEAIFDQNFGSICVVRRAGRCWTAR